MKIYKGHYYIPNPKSDLVPQNYIKIIDYDQKYVKIKIYFSQTSNCNYTLRIVDFRRMYVYNKYVNTALYQVLNKGKFNE